MESICMRSSLRFTHFRMFCVGVVSRTDMLLGQPEQPVAAWIASSRPSLKYSLFSNLLSSFPPAPPALLD